MPASDPFDGLSIDTIDVAGTRLRRGAHVILRPSPGGDVFDLELRGRRATIESIEQDYEDQIYLAVTIDDDPGQDLGFARQPGHRFFFSPAEVEPIGGDE